MKKVRVILLIFALFFVCKVLYSLPIDLQIGARPLAMGGAFVAVSNDSNASYWNPAGLSKIPHPQLNFMYSLYSEFSQLNLNFLGYSQKNIGFSWVNIGASLKEGENNASNKMTENHYIFAYGIEVNKMLSIGTNLKRLVIDSEIGGGSGIGFDIGALYRRKKVSFGVVLRNLASDVKNENIPSSLRFGTAINIKRLLFSLDIDTKKDIEGKEGLSYRIHAGMEFRVFDSLYLRAGTDNGDISFGLGMLARNFQFDFCGLSDATAGNVFRLSAGYKFMPYKPKPRRKKIKTSRKVSRKEHKKIEDLIRRGEMYFNKKKYSSAEKIFKKVLKKEPGNDKSVMYLKKIYWAQAGIFYKKRKYKKAIEKYKEILKIDPQHEESKQRIEICKQKLKKKSRRKRK
ncbi:MAG: hypothetical protein J7L42_02205 [Elusimicrobia bacterium]|nr:hypothetical protein [Elusimicrobiota bacterium]